MKAPVLYSAWGPVFLLGDGWVAHCGLPRTRRPSVRMTSLPRKLLLRF